ncbi:IRF2-like protein, partial [Mya arenaria]
MSIEEGRITSRATPTSKGEKTRYIRPVERQRMRPWLIEALEKDDVPGLTWQTRNQGIFRISWKHAANQCFHMQNDTNLFERWAIHTGRHDDSDHKRWKANFRCALNSLPDVMELKDHGVKKGSNAFKVYKFLDEKETKANRENKALAKIKKETTFTSVPDRHTYLKSSESGDEASSAVGGIPNLSCLVPASSDEMLVDAGGDDDAGKGIDASALEQISIEQLSRMGEVSKMKLDIRDSEQNVYLCSWCKKVFPSRVELFQHFLVEHQERLLAREEYHQEGSNLQREIEDLEKKVFNFTREKFKSKDSGEVIEDGQVVDISTTHIMTSQDVYIEDQALDLTVTPAHVPTVIRQEVALDLSSGAIGKKHKFIVTASPSKGQTKVIAKKRRSGALDMDYIKKFDEFGMVGKAQTKRQLSLVTKKKEEKEKMKKSEGGKKDVDPASQHSMEDIAHAEILISLKSAANEDEETDDAEEDAGDTDEDSEKGEKTQAAKGVKRARADDDDEEDEDEDDAAKAFRCGICSNTFSDAATLYAHVTEHKNEYKCGICNEVYDDKDNYVQHLVTHVPSAELLQEANKSPPKEHKCNFCEKAFPSAKKLEKHKTEHYTIIAMKTKGDKVAMVVHPKQGNDEADTRVALIHQKQANEVPETKTNPAGEIEKEAEVKKKSVPVDGNQDVYIVYSSEGGDKVCEVVTAPSETSSEHEGMEVEKNADTDSVDGMQAKIELSKAGSKEINEGTNRKAVKEEKSQEQTKGNVCKDGQNGESQLPAFSEIVKDVDEFFIKETKPQLKKDVKEEPVGEDPEDEIESKGEETRNEEELMEIIITNREETVEEISEYEFKCIICKEEHDTQQKLNEHMKLHSIFELANAKGSIEGNEKTSTEGEKKSKVFICKLCGSNFNQFTDLKKHVASHLEKSKKREVKEGGLKETVPRAKRGRPPIRKVPGMKEGNETGRTATSKQKAKTDQAISEKLQGGTSILAAALKKGPKFQLSPALFEKTKGAVEKVDERGDAKPKISEIKKKLEAPPKPAIVSDTSEPEKESFVETKSSNSTEIVTEQNEVKVNDLKEKKEDESFASKLLVQGVTSYLQNKDGTITQEQKIEFVPTPIASMPMPAVVTQNISSITATNPPAKSPQAANIPVINPAVISNLVTMGNITSIGNQAINIAGKVAPVNQLGPVRIMTASDIKNAAPQQVIFLKQGTPLPVQLATQLSALQQSVMTAPQMPTLQQVSLPVTHFGGLQPTAISIPQLTQVQQTTISIPQQTAVPATVMQSAVPKTGATKPVLPAASVATNETTASTTVNPVIAEHTDANSKVNPQVQSNLLNMVLARMGQAGSNVSVITTAATSVAASISSTGPTITAVSSEAFKTAVGGKSLLTASVLAGSSDGKATGQFTKEELLQQAKSLQLKD